MILNTNYKIPEITLNNICEAIDRHGFDLALKQALEHALFDLRNNPQSVVITETLSWSYHLSKCAGESSDMMVKGRYIEAAAFCRRLAHRAYWVARKEELVEYNPNFIQVA